MVSKANKHDFIVHGPFSTFTVNEDVLNAELSKVRDRRKNTEIALSKATTGGSTTSRSSMHGDVSSFLDIFESELIRVTDFIDAQQKHLEFSARVLLTNAENAALVGQGQQDYRTPRSNKDIHNTLKQRADILVKNGVELQHFISKNYTSLKQIATRADQALQTNCIASLESRFVKTGLNSALICIVSDIYDVIRVAMETLRNKASGQSSGMWKAPSSFERSTTKYWVEENRLTELLLVCAAEAPLLVYGKQGSLTSPEHRLSKESEGDKLWNSLATPITSVYFDSPDLSLYKERIARAEGAQLLRARWYGSKPTGDGIIFLELKTHHEKWVNTKSIKERASVRECDMLTFLKKVTWTMNDAQAMILRASPALEGDKLAKASDLLLRMHKLVVKYKLAPCVRSVYLRAAFQSPKNNDLRLTIDRNVTLIDETATQQYHDDHSAWCLSDYAVIQRSMVTEAPFVVFEVKLAGNDNMPQGLVDLESDGAIQGAPKFSKFLSGAAAFNSHKISTLPYWAAFPAFDSMFNRESNNNKGGLSKNKVVNHAHLANNGSVEDKESGSDDSLEGTMDTRASSESWTASFTFSNEEDTSFNQSSSKTNLSKSPKKDSTIRDRRSLIIAAPKPTRVEPKSYFANERTFIQWISAAILVLTVSTLIFGYDEEQYFHAAAVLGFAAVFLVLYATYVYFRRIRLLSSGKPYGYVDYVGPAILAIGVIAGVGVVLVDYMRFGRSGDDQQSLARTSTRLPFLRQDEQGNCFRHAMTGINALEFEPSDVILDTKHNNESLLVVSQHLVMSYPLSLQEGDTPTQLLDIPNSDLEGLAMVPSNSNGQQDRIFTLSEGPLQTELIELGWSNKEMLEIVGRWQISEDASQAEGLTFVPSNDSTPSGQDGRLYISIDGLIHTFEVPPLPTISGRGRRNEEADEEDEDEDEDEDEAVQEPPIISLPDNEEEGAGEDFDEDDAPSSTMNPNEEEGDGEDFDEDDAPSSTMNPNPSNSNSLTRVDSINMKLINQGFPSSNSAQENKIASMHFFEGVTYMLHDNHRVIRAWDLSTGEFLAEIPLPHIENGFSDNWEGLALERRGSRDGKGSQLRGSTSSASSSSDIYLHLTLDTPPQIWTFLVQKGNTRGALILPDCAAVIPHAGGGL